MNSLPQNQWLRFAALLFSALAMGMHLAHALELPPKMAWDAELFLTVQGSLYRLFGTIGPVLEIGALVLVSILTLRLRGQPAFRLTLLSNLALLLALAVWLLVVMPAHKEITGWQAGAIPADWAQWRQQWQYGQAGIFFVHLLGFSALLLSVLRHPLTSPNP